MKSGIFHILASGCLAALATACASERPAPVNVAAHGRIAETHEAAELPGTVPANGIYKPGMGGAVGGAIAGLIMGVGTDPAHTVHVINLADGTQRWVRSTEVFAIGECVDVLVTDAKQLSEVSWKLGDAWMRKTTGCK